MRDSEDPPTGSSTVMKKPVGVCLIVALAGFPDLVPKNRLDAFGPSSQRNEASQKPLTNFDYISEEGMEIDDETPLPQLIAHSPSVTIEPQIFATGRRYLILLGYDYGGGSSFLPNGRAGRSTADFLAEVRRLAMAQER
jgi:hypothetical protein